mmetsp:Transcript_35264/g.101428  ORF Transcript_35264/g.101428 Transcript_35264/m.101428 type:complete len:252 (+) Transcript_35264:1401-2156(+)
MLNSVISVRFRCTGPRPALRKRLRDTPAGLPLKCGKWRWCDPRFGCGIAQNTFRSFNGWGQSMAAWGPRRPESWRNRLARPGELGAELGSWRRDVLGLLGATEKVTSLSWVWSSDFGSSVWMPRAIVQRLRGKPCSTPSGSELQRPGTLLNWRTLDVLQLWQQQALPLLTAMPFWKPRSSEHVPRWRLRSNLCSLLGRQLPGRLAGSIIGELPPSKLGGGLWCCRAAKSRTWVLGLNKTMWRLPDPEQHSQ